MQGGDLDITCSCGLFRARLTGVGPGSGSHLMCYCKDCQAAARHLGADDTLKPRGGSDIYHTTPSRLSIEDGAEHLSCLRLSPKGLMRWYAGCCNTPLFNTLPRGKLAFVGVLTPTLRADGAAEAIGPVIAVVNTSGAQPGPGTLRDRGFLKAGWQIMRRLVLEKLRGTARDNPLFDESGVPIVSPRVLTLDERRAATRF